MRKNTCLNNNSGFLKKNLMYIGFVMMAVTIPFIYNNCGQAQFGVDSAKSKTGVVKKNTDLCLSNQVAVGVDVNGDVLCAQKISHQGRLCPVGETLYEYDDITNTSQCLKNCEFAGNVTNSLCPIGANLTSVGVNNSVLCQSHPSHIGLIGSSISHYLLGFDQDNKPQMEVLVACPGTETELNIECPGTEELIDIVDGANGKEAVCREVVFSPVNAQCPDGQAYIGTSQNNIVCQSLFVDSSQNLGSKNCSVGMYLDIVDGSLVCKPLPQKNDSHVCPSGSYSVGIVNGLPSCKALSGEKFNGTCDPGQYIIGYAGGEVVCEVLPVSGNFNEACSSGTYPHAIFNNTLECLPHSYNQQICVPGTTEQFAVNNGIGSRVCDEAGIDYDMHTIECFSDYELNNLGLCVPSEVTPPTLPPCATGLTRVGDVCEDSKAPSISFDKKPDSSTEDTTATFVARAVDNIAIASVECRLRKASGAWTSYRDCKDSAPGKIGLGYGGYNSLLPGTYIFRVKATDTSSNVTTKDYRWTVRLTCEAGYKVSGGKCVPICGNKQVLKGNICVDRYVWVNVWGQSNSIRSSHAKACATAGYTAAPNQGYGICASGERAVRQGGSWNKIKYAYGRNSYTVGGTIIRSRDGSARCYKVGQKQDKDRKDKLMAVLCDTQSKTVAPTPYCKTGQILINGECVWRRGPICPAGYHAPADKCIPIAPRCDWGQVLQNGICVTPLPRIPAPPKCGKGESIINGVCVRTQPYCKPGQTDCVQIPVAPINTKCSAGFVYNYAQKTCVKIQVPSTGVSGGFKYEHQNILMK